MLHRSEKDGHLGGRGETYVWLKEGAGKAERQI